MRKLLKTFASVIPKREMGGAVKNTQSQLFLIKTVIDCIRMHKYSKFMKKKQRKSYCNVSIGS